MTSAVEPETGPVVADDPAPGVRRLTLNRPARRNALSRHLVAELLAAVERIRDDMSVRVAVIRGAGSSFCAGADLQEHFTDEDPGPDIGTSPLWDRLTSLRVPVIASVHGWAVTGGFLLAYCCDLIVASDDARFRDTHAALGLLPTGGETQRLPRRVGAALARELMFTSRVLPATEAQGAGLVNRVVPLTELEAATLELAAEVAASSPRSVAAIKQAVNGGLGGDLGSGLRLEAAINRQGRANHDPDPAREARLGGAAGRR